jgi:anti-sigma B factor antagonist
MTFARWLSLSETEREAEKRLWRPFEPGYWQSLATEAAARFNAEFGSNRHVVKVFKSLYHARELIVAVQTNSSRGRSIKLPTVHLGFRVMQFANRLPEGVLVEAGPPSELSTRPKGTGRRPTAAVPPSKIQKPKAGSHRVLALEGEIDLHVAPRIATELRDLIGERPEKLVIDLSKASYIDSSGLAILIDAMQKVEAYRGKLYLSGMSKSVRTIFEMSRLDQTFRIRRDVDEALEGRAAERGSPSSDL